MATIIIGLRLSVIIFFFWLFILSLRYYEHRQKFWAGCAMYAAIILFFAPEHLARLTGHGFSELNTTLMVGAANLCLLISAWLSIGLLIERSERGKTKKVVIIGVIMTILLIIAVGVA